MIKNIALCEIANLPIWSKAKAILLNLKHMTVVCEVQIQLYAISAKDANSAQLPACEWRIF